MARLKLVVSVAETTQMESRETVSDLTEDRHPIVRPNPSAREELILMLRGELTGLRVSVEFNECVELSRITLHTACTQHWRTGRR